MNIHLLEVRYEDGTMDLYEGSSVVIVQLITEMDMTHVTEYRLRTLFDVRVGGEDDED